MRAFSHSGRRHFPGLLVGILIVASATLLLAIGVNTANAAPAAAIDSRAPALEDADGGGWEITLGFTNLTEGTVDLKATTAKALEGCEPKPDKTQLPPAEHTDVTIEIQKVCKADEGITIVAELTPPSVPQQTFPINPEVKPSAEEVDWDELWVFAYALVISLLLVAVVYVWWCVMTNSAQNLLQPLSSLDAAWSFNDNWVTNVTAVGALLTGIFGTSEIVQAFLGPDAEPSIALATVGAAIALAFAAAGPIVLLAAKNYTKDAETKKREDAFTPLGLMLAAALVLTSAFGQLWVVLQTGRNLDLGGLEDELLIPFVAATALLVIYACRSLLDVLERGIAEPDPPPPTAIDAAKLIVDALKATPNVDEDQIAQVLQKAEAYPEGMTSPGDDYIRRKRSPLL